MKLNVPALFRRFRQTREQSVPGVPQRADHMKPASLAKIRLWLLVGSVILLAGLAFFVFQLMSQQVLHAMQRDMDVTTSLVAARVSSTTGYFAGSAAALARDPEIAALLKDGTPAQRSAREEALRNVFPKSVHVRLLLPGINRIDPQASPPLGYAELDQMRAAETGTTPPPAEVHQVRTPLQFVSIVRRVDDPAGSGVVGHIMMSLSNAVLKGALSGLQHMDGYLELQQTGTVGKPAAIAAQGDAHLRQGEAARVVPIAGTRWQVAYWPATSSLEYLGKVGSMVLVASLVCAALLLVLVWLLFRRIQYALQLDQVSLVSLCKDFRAGRVEREYASGLAELSGTLEHLVQLASSTRKSAPGSSPDARSAVRERDEEITAQKTTPDEAGGGAPPGGLPPGFMTHPPVDNLIVEEEPLHLVDETAAAPDASIFRAYDIRGVVDRTLTNDTVYQIGRAIGSETLQRGCDTVAVGRDGRLSGPALAHALIEGILATGCHVKDIGCVPTPVLYFATYHLDTRSGVIVTGSHNPPDYNGLKIVIDGETLSGDSIQELRERIETQNFISGQGELEIIDVLPAYIERIRGDISLARPLRVVVDCGNGVAGVVAPELLRLLGCMVTELYCEVDGNFPNHHPDPSKEENLQELISMVQSGHADIGLAFDGDGDRLGVVSPNGGIIWPDRVLMLFAIDILDRNPGGLIIYDVKCTRHLDAVIRDHGGEPLMWKTGHSLIKAKIRATGALLAGEMSGHIFINERWYGFDDGIYAAARLLEILSRDEHNCQEIFDALPNSVNTPELNVQMREGEPQVFIRKLLENARFEDATVYTIDGMRVEFADGWGLVRASNTTPVLVLRFEADNEKSLQRIMDEFRRVMLQVEPRLQLPF
jgi:phosphomannomutase/phosphoglucomutase